MEWFTVDRAGLAKVLERRGKFFALAELISNSWDTDATKIDLTLTPVPNRPLCRVTIEDDHPDGFKDLRSSWTLFAESEKKGDPTKRGRFNLGEKLFLALCDEAEIVTTTGGVSFDKDGRHLLRRKRERGSVISALLRMTRGEFDTMHKDIAKMLPPSGKRTTFNGAELEPRQPSGTAKYVILMTEVADEAGFLKRTYRAGAVDFFEPRPGEVGTLYEMGIPVVETGDRWHANVQQKIPLNLERDGVSTSYLRDVRAAMLNTMSSQLKSVEEATAAWARDALASSEVKKEAATRVIDLRFGERRVIADPSDREGEDIAKSRGFTVITGGSMTGEEWETVKKFSLALPAGQVTPSPKPFADGAPPLKMLEEWTPVVAEAAQLGVTLARKLLDVEATVQVANDRGWGFEGMYSRSQRRIILNYGNPAIRAAVDKRDKEHLLRFYLHELAHHFEANHLAEGFHEACTNLGAKLAMLAAMSPTSTGLL